jgi:hypothetical protein
MIHLLQSKSSWAALSLKNTDGHSLSKTTLNYLAEFCSERKALNVEGWSHLSDKDMQVLQNERHFKKLKYLNLESCTKFTQGTLEALEKTFQVSKERVQGIERAHPGIYVRRPDEFPQKPDSRKKKERFTFVKV